MLRDLSKRCAFLCQSVSVSCNILIYTLTANEKKYWYSKIRLFARSIHPLLYRFVKFNASLRRCRNAESVNSLLTRGVRYDDFWSWMIKMSPRSAFEEISC